MDVVDEDTEKFLVASGRNGLGVAERRIRTSVRIPFRKEFLSPSGSRDFGCDVITRTFINHNVYRISSLSIVYGSILSV